MSLIIYNTSSRKARFQTKLEELLLNVNRLRELRESRMMSSAELARRARLSPLTVSRVEKGMECRLETKRKILTALGLSPGEKEKVFPEA
jgi:transcriptional regulator with XRE-family HTH domain